ncbi:hypothetical protein FMN63_22005 [Stappia sp. BW2]|nr:hypothetical protein FMN63_22005 [Stappia sp. BW2]
MPLGYSVTEIVLLYLFVVLSFVSACWLARVPRNAGIGIALGVVLGISTLTATSALVGFLHNVLPFGQVDFWFANLLSGIFG